MTFKDSNLMFPSRLKDLPEAFGFADSALKGDFPHKFASKKNLYETVYHLPEKKFYHTERMSPAELQEFNRWHDDNCDALFDFKQEAIRYCKQDVIVLAHAVTRFRDEILEIAEIDPWYSAYTTAGLALQIFCSPNFRRDNPEPMNGLNKKNTRSPRAAENREHK